MRRRHKLTTKADDCRAALGSALASLRQAVKLCPAQSFTNMYTRGAIAAVKSALSDISAWPASPNERESFEK